MRKLLDLLSGDLAIIDWQEQGVVPAELEERFKELDRKARFSPSKKEQQRDRDRQLAGHEPQYNPETFFTDEEQAELDKMMETPLPLRVRVVSLEVRKGVNNPHNPTTFTLHGSQLVAISNALVELQESLAGKTIPFKETLPEEY